MSTYCSIMKAKPRLTRELERDSRLEVTSLGTPWCGSISAMVLSNFQMFHLKWIWSVLLHGKILEHQTVFIYHETEKAGEECEEEQKRGVTVIIIIIILTLCLVDDEEV